MPSSVEKERVQHVNILMNEIYGQVSDIYESLIDKDFDALKNAIDDQIDTLLYLRNSTSDES
jgi:hypothetical protein